MEKKRYRVIAEDAVIAGYKTGEEFEHEFEPFAEAALLEGGGIEILGEPTKQELLAKAQELDIEGRSNMSKEELKAAIDDAYLNSDDEAQPVVEVEA